MAVVESWSETIPCLIHPDNCTVGGSLLAWIKPSSSCAHWMGLFGSQGKPGVGSDTDGVIVACNGNDGTGFKYVFFIH